MATHDYVIANASGAAVRQDINNALAAIVSNNSSATEPGTTYAFQFWFDTTNNILKIRNAANSAWIDWITTTATALLPDGTVGAPSLTFASETDTGLYRIAANTLGIATSGTERVEISDTGIIINEGGDDANVRIEGDNNANLVFIDAGNNRVGIGTSTPLRDVDIVQTAGDCDLRVESTNTGGDARLELIADNAGVSQIRLGDQDVVNVGLITYEHTNNNLKFNVNSKECLRIDSSGNVSIRESSNTVSTGASLYLYDIAGAASSGNSSGRIAFYSSDNTDGASIRAEIANYYENSSADSALTFKTYNGSLSEQMRIDSSGNIGVGTTAAQAKLDVRTGATGFAQFAHASGNGGVRITGEGGSSNANLVFSNNRGTSTSDEYTIQLSGADDALVFRSGGPADTERFRIDSSGNVGIGTTSPNSYSGYTALTLNNATTGSLLDLEVNGTRTGTFLASATQVKLGSETSAFLRFDTNSTERMRIDSSGRLLVGSTTAGSMNGGTIVAGDQLGTGGSVALATPYTSTDTLNIYLAQRIAQQIH